MKTQHKYPRVLDFFNEPHVAGCTYPHQVNGVGYRKYRVTVEVVDEPDDVIRERLIALYKSTEENSHHTMQWRDLALRYGIFLQSTWVRAKKTWKRTARKASKKEWDAMKARDEERRRHGW